MTATYDALFNDNPTALKLASDQSDFWEYRLTVELLRQHLSGPTRRWSDLKHNLYTQRTNRLSAREALQWIQDKIGEASDFLDPLTALYTESLPHSWGEPG